MFVNFMMTNLCTILLLTVLNYSIDMDPELNNLSNYLLNDDGTFPNNSSLPLLIYHHALPEGINNAALFESRFEENNWGNSWRNGIFNYHHYHSISHEVLGICSGYASVKFGGPQGIELDVEAGDVVIIPAGVAHNCLSHSADFRCVGAYPDGMDYDMNYGKPGERPGTDHRIKQVPLPGSDPVFGAEGLLQLYWRA